MIKHVLPRTRAEEYSRGVYKSKKIAEQGWLVSTQKETRARSDLVLGTAPDSFFKKIAAMSNLYLVVDDCRIRHRLFVYLQVPNQDVSC